MKFLFPAILPPSHYEGRCREALMSLFNKDFEKPMMLRIPEIPNPQQQLATALERLKKETKGRIVLEKKLDSLRDELGRAHQKVETLENQNKILQERNIKLESANKNLEKEKNMISKYNITLEKLCLVYEAHIADAKGSRDDADKQK
ncbi:hypothetical protein Lser_V15G32134 [Lactuca serriola]